MSGETAKIKKTYIPPPVDGINLIAPPNGLKPTEARELRNYLVYDWGIRERPAASSLHNTAGYLFSFYTNDSTQKILIVQGGASGSVHRMDTALDTTPTDITGAVTINGTAASAGNVFSCHFNKHLFFFDEVDVPWLYSIAGGGNCAATSITGPTGGGTTVATGWSYKNRLYMLEGSTGNPTQVHYSGTVGAIAGAFTAVDFAQVLDRPAPLLCGSSWGYNQGLQSEELFVLIGASGEVLIYSGDWPAAANWQLIARASIPKPNGRDCIRKLGQELLISTVRGVIPLSKVIAGQKDADYFSITRNIGPFGVFANHQFVVDSETPFLFGSNVPVAGSSGVYPYPPVPNPNTDLYVQNYERGAWSSLRFPTSGTSSMVTANGYLVYLSNGSVFAMNLNGIVGENTANAATIASWKTPFFDFGENRSLKSNHIRLLGTDLNSSVNSLKSTSYILSDYLDTGTAPSVGLSNKTTTTTLGVPAIQQLAPSGNGKSLSFCFSKTPAAEMNELYGFHTEYEVGGSY